MSVQVYFKLPGERVQEGGRRYKTMMALTKMLIIRNGEADTRFVTVAFPDLQPTESCTFIFPVTSRQY